MKHGFWIALAVVLVFMVGQLSWLRPSRREIFLMKLRAEARRLGLSARLLAPPDWYRGERPAGGLLACYSLLTPENSPDMPYFRIERLSGGEDAGMWVWRAGDRAVLESLDFPPEAAALLSLEARANAVSAWWTEGLGPEALPALLTLMQTLRERLQG